MATSYKPFLFKSDLPEPPQNGSSIGLKGNRDQAGTLGCWLRLPLSSGLSLPVILTCNHVLFSNDTPTQAQINRNGMRLGELVGKFEATCPAAYDLDWNMQILDDAINFRETRLYEQLHRLRHASVGTVLAASGIRKNAENRRLDWALIKEHRVQYDHAEVSKGSWVTKQGRTTGTTNGIVSKMRREIHWPEPKMRSEEIEVFGTSADFALPGDAGSMVTDIDGALIGIVFGAETRIHGFTVGFVTTFRDIVDDVKSYTTGTLSL
ncbi:hypothetical protein MMC27_005621 [Xylographa pallens]|nr:hypothetical protein [Xylographa pallens]